MMRNQVAIASSLLLICVLLFPPTRATAGSLQVSPTRVVLAPSGGSRSLRIRNLGDDPTLIQVEAVAWSDDLDAAPRASEIIALPPVFEIPGNGQQLLRIALRQPSDLHTEQAYRLLITEVPRRPVDGEGIMFTLRLDLPVFVTPAGAEPDPVWTIRDTLEGETELVLRNDGQAHLRVSKLTLQELHGAAPILTIEQGATALPGKEHRWMLDQPAHTLPRALQVRAETQRGELVMPLHHVRDWGPPP